MSHSMEASDRSNIVVLFELESDMVMRQQFELINLLKSWFWSEQAVFLAGIKCLSNLLPQGMRLASTNLAEEFDQVIERERVR